MASKTVTRYGPRYGRTIRERVAAAEETYQTLQKCPKCGYIAAKRIAAGIWQCRKCNAKYASRAYQLRQAPEIRGSTEETYV